MISLKDPLYPIRYIMSKYILIQNRFCESLLPLKWISPKIFILYSISSVSYTSTSLFDAASNCIIHLISSITIHVCLSVHSSYRLQFKCQCLEDIIMHFSFVVTYYLIYLYYKFYLLGRQMSALFHSLRYVCYNISVI